MNKKIKTFEVWRAVLYLVVTGSLIPSAIITVITFMNTGFHTYAKILLIGGAITVEGAKVIFPKTAVEKKDMNMWGRSFLMAIGMLAMSASLIFSFAFAINESNAVKNDFYSNTDEAKAANKSIETRDTLIGRLEGEIEDLKADKKADLSVLDPVNYRSKRAKIKKSYNDSITKKSDELTRQQNTATKPVNTNVTTIKKIDVSLSSVLSPEQERMFWGILVILIELSGFISTVILSLPRKNIKKISVVYEDEVDNNSTERQNDPDQNDYVKPENNIGMKRTPNPITAKALDTVGEVKDDKPSDKLEIGKHTFNPCDLSPTGAEPHKKIGFAADRPVEKKQIGTAPDTEGDCEYSRKDIEEYLRYVYDNTPTGRPCSGQNIIKEHTMLSLEQIKAIRYHLKRLGIVEINNKTNRTFIVIESLNEALKLI